ncbi:hypothetical protein D041_0627B, partial [Vibrio parahaemolyticus EKP-008]
AMFTHCVLRVHISPVVQVVREQVRRNTYLFHSVELILSRQLTVFQ